MKPSAGWSVLTVASLRVRVPVLSLHSTVIEAMSCRALSRVTSTPNFESSTDPSAAASVNVAGRATGMDASKIVNTSGGVCANAMPWTCAKPNTTTTRPAFSTNKSRTK